MSITAWQRAGLAAPNSMFTPTNNDIMIYG